MYDVYKKCKNHGKIQYRVARKVGMELYWGVWWLVVALP